MIFFVSVCQGIIHVLRNHKKGAGEKKVSKGQFLITFSTESNHKGEGRRLSENSKSRSRNTCMVSYHDVKQKVPTKYNFPLIKKVILLRNNVKYQSFHRLDNHSNLANDILYHKAKIFLFERR